MSLVSQNIRLQNRPSPTLSFPYSNHKKKIFLIFSFFFLSFWISSFVIAKEAPPYPLPSYQKNLQEDSQKKDLFTGQKEKKQEEKENTKRKATIYGKAQKFPLPVPKEIQPLLRSLKDLLRELGPIMPDKNFLSGKHTTIQMITMAISPVKGTILFFKEDAKRIPHLFKSFQNYRFLSSKEKGKVVLQGLRILLHSIDAMVTTKVTTKGVLTFVKNLKKYSHLGATKAISIAIGKTSIALIPELKQYMAWAKYSYLLHRALRYMEKNYSSIQGKLQRFLQEGEKLLKQKFPQLKKDLPKSLKKGSPIPKEKILHKKRKNLTFVVHLER